jgi:hypothetical protein
MSKSPGQNEHYSEEETQRRFEAALRGARTVGHAHRSTMKLGKPRAKPKKSPPKRVDNPR